MLQKNLTEKSVSKKCLLDALKKMALLIHPFVPHLSEEMWKLLGSKEMAVNQSWPKASNFIEKTNFKLAIQINGKTKKIIDLSNKENEAEAKELAINDPKIKKIIDKKTIKRTIYVPNKILNIVI